VILKSNSGPTGHTPLGAIDLSQTFFIVSVPVVGGVAPSPGVVDRCTSMFGFAFWTVVGVDACPEPPCCEIVPPQLPLLIILSLVLELDTGLDMNYQQTLLE
jgi:hypothetical protein